MLAVVVELTSSARLAGLLSASPGHWVVQLSCAQAQMDGRKRQQKKLRLLDSICGHAT